MPTIGTGVRVRRTDERSYYRALWRAIVPDLVRRTESDLAEAGREYGLIREAIANIKPPPNYGQLTQAQVRAHMLSIKRYHTERFRHVMRRLIGIRVNYLSDLYVAPLLERAIEENVALIRTIGPRYHQAIKDEVLRITATGVGDREALAQSLTRAYNTTGYNLRRLTRDQTSKVIGSLSKIRQEEVGIRRYQWSTSKDERVRQSHRDNEGQIFSWNDPPAGTGHPGNDVQCRCVAVPVLDYPRASRVRRRR